jgi:hypothetical protein
VQRGGTARDTLATPQKTSPSENCEKQQWSKGKTI